VIEHLECAFIHNNASRNQGSAFVLPPLFSFHQSII